MALALIAVLSGQTALFPLKDLKPGMHGTGRTVFNGNKIEDFQVEILGVFDNIGPRNPSSSPASPDLMRFRIVEHPWAQGFWSGFSPQTRPQQSIAATLDTKGLCSTQRG